MSNAKAKRPGAYILAIRLRRRRHIQIGRLGSFTFEAGTYAYVGSAMNGLDARVARHMRREKQHRWHIDYLLQHGEIVDVFEFESADRRECQINDRVHKRWRGVYPVAGFGSSDCRCASHLHLLPSPGRLGLPILE
jgi:Uri superfamily endonuclease